MRSHWMTALAFGIAAAAAPATLRAQTAPPPGPAHGAPPPAPSASPWQVSLTPYMWLPSLSGTVHTPLPRIGDQTARLSGSSLISDMDAVPVMATGEVRYGPLAVSADLVYSAIRQGFSTRDILFEGGHSRAVTTIATFLATLRVLDRPRQSLELGWGARLWSMETKLSFNPGLLAGRIRKTTTTWVDPILALRYGAMLSPRFGVSFYGDVGGFDVGSRLTWQVAGSVDYHWSEATILRAGWRYLTVDKTRGDFGLDLSFNGPFLAATFRF